MHACIQSLAPLAESALREQGYYYCFIHGEDAVMALCTHMRAALQEGWCRSSPWWRCA